MSTVNGKIGDITNKIVGFTRDLPCKGLTEWL